MKTPRSRATPEERQEASDLTRFLGVFFDRYMSEGKPVPPEVHPMRFLSEMAEKAPKRALIGVRMAVADCVEMAAHWTDEKVQEADATLKTEGALSLTEVRQHIAAIRAKR